MTILLNFTCIWIIFLFMTYIYDTLYIYDILRYIYDTLNCSILLKQLLDTRLLSELIYLIFAN